MARSEGFRDQRLCVVPRPLVAQALRAPATRRLVVTDAGYYPDAAGHRMQRPAGVPEAVLLVCTAGAGWAASGGRRVDVVPATCTVLPAGVPHAYGAAARRPWSIWWCHLRGPALHDLPSLAVTGGAPARLPLRSPDRVAALLDDVVTALERGVTPAHLTAAGGAAWHLLTRIVTDGALPETGTPLDRALRHLEERVTSTVRVAELAATVGVSPSHLGALFRRATGGGVAAYHTGLRMARARTLLDTTTLGVAEVARAVGYDDPLYFSRRFRRAHGVSPTGYRLRPKG